jgi:hypothetical protein
MRGMAGTSLSGFQALADTFDFSKYNTVCDIGGATGTTFAVPLVGGLLGGGSG